MKLHFFRQGTLSAITVAAIIHCVLAADFVITMSNFALSSYSTLVPSVAYEINFTLANAAIPAGSATRLQFGSRYTITNLTLSTNCKASTSTVAALSDASCSVIYNPGSKIYEVILNGMFSGSSTYSFLRLSFIIDNPYAKASETVDVKIYNAASSQIGSGQFYINYVATVMADCSISSSSQKTGENSTHTYTLTPQYRVIANSFLEIQMPAWYNSTGAGNDGSSTLICTGQTGTSTSNLTCSIGAVVSLMQTITITTGLVNADSSSPSKMQITLQSLKNPWSTEPFGPIVISLMYGLEQKIQQCPHTYLTVSQANTLATFNFPLTNLNIGQATTGVRLSYFPKNILPKPNNLLKLQFPTWVTVNYSGSVTVLSRSTSQILFSSISVYSFVAFNVTNPPHTRPFTFTCTTYYVNTATGLAYVTESKQVGPYYPTTGAITNATATPNSFQVSEVTTYTLKFTITNKLIIGSFINIVFPADLTVQFATSSCTATPYTCSAVSASNITVTMTAAVAASTQLTVAVSNVKNTHEAKTTATFAIYTYYETAQYDTLVDSIATGITVTMTAKLLSGGSVSPLSFVTNEITDYVITLALDDPIPIGSSFSIVVPSDVQARAATQVTAASFSITSCTTNYAPATTTLSITGCFASAGLTAASLSFTLSNMLNPPSLKPTSSFTVYILGPAGATMSYISTSLTVTMATPIQTTSVQILPTSAVVGVSNTYTMTIRHNISTHSINDYTIITFPPLMTLPSSPTCTAISGIANVSCLRPTATQLKVVYITPITSPIYQIKFSLSSQVNYLIADSPQSYKFQTSNSLNYLMEEYASYSLTYTESTLNSVTTNNDDNIAVGQASNVTLTITNSLALYPSLDAALTKLDITVPASFVMGSQCTSTAGTCSVVGSIYRVTGVGLSLTNLKVTLKSIVLNYFSPVSDTFGVVYTYNGFNVSEMSSGITLSVYCTSPCQRCKTTKTACQSCLPPPNTLVYYDPTTKLCGESCISGKYPDLINYCQPCVQPCALCLNANDCTSCVNNTWLFQSTSRCLDVCPDQYYNKSNGKCAPCQRPCFLCTAAATCLSCATGFYSNFWCVNASMCPVKTYANTSTMKCEPCEPPCSECSLIYYNCTTCVTGYLYYSNLCVQTCPNKMYADSTNKFCLNCTSPCDTCRNGSYCLSCLFNFLSAGSCVGPQACPSGTYPNSTENKCKSCPTGCTGCINSTNCTNCNSAIYVFYEYMCYTVCPSGTYKVGATCQLCTNPCSTCTTSDTNCLSCVAPKVFYQNKCHDLCPAGTFNNSNICSACQSQCQTCTASTSCSSCTGNKYLEGSNCVNACSDGTYADINTNKCQSCTGPCLSCSSSPSTCTKCIPPQFQFQSTCIDSCPPAYFEVSGSCVTCSNCLNCLNAYTCLQCIPGFYQYKGVCYASCPEVAPIPDETTDTCGSCDATCLTCEGLSKNCTSCYRNTFLYLGTCMKDCPLGFIEDLVSNNCIKPLIGKVIYFPFTFCFVFFFIVIIVAKCLYPETERITAMSAAISICEFGSWCLLTYILSVDYTLEASLLQIGIYVGLAIIMLSIGTGIAYNIAICKQYDCDRGLQSWKEFDKGHVYSYRSVAVISSFTFRFFRILYSRLFNRPFFSMYIADGSRFLTSTNRLSFATIVLNSLPMIGISVYLIYKKEIYDQTFFCAVDTLILGFFTAVLLTIDSCKSPDFFETIREGLPFLKYKNMKNDESIAGQSLLSRGGDQEYGNNRRAISEVGDKEKDQIFRRIAFLPNLNKFGHLNILEDQNGDREEIKSLPEISKLHEYGQYDPNHISDGDRVVGDLDDLFFMDDEKLRQQQQREEEERQRLKRMKEQEEERLRKEEEERRRRQLMEEDQQERVNVQFPDLVAIDRVENKNGKGRKNPLQLLSNCKKVDEKQVNEKALKKLEDIGKKNGIDPEFMKQTFGVEKNHNPELLNSIIDKHNHVKREAVKELFNEKNNPEVLQELFGKNSKMDPNKLKQILNDPDSKTLISNLASKEDGILSPQLSKQLFEKDSKYSKQFTKKLLSDDNGMDKEKLKQLLKSSNEKGQQSPLKALKKVGGENLENTELLNNMLGADSILDPQNFTKVVNELPLKAVQHLFENRNKNSDLITSKILNNKKMNLNNLAPILEDEELLQELAEVLGDEDPNLQENLLNLFKNAENVDPEKLKEMLRDPIIKEKLLKSPVDPEFLNAILSKEANTDMQLLSDTLKEMSLDSIQETFKFDPQKNINYNNLGKLFEQNNKTDPQLVAKMLEPQMVKALYCKGNDTKMLNKLVEKGNEFDPQVIKGVYGKQKNHFFESHTEKMTVFQEEKNDEYRSQKQYSLGFQKNLKNQASMSKTAGGMLSFLTPIVPKVHQKSKMNLDDQEDEWGSQGEKEDDGEISEEQTEQNGPRRRKSKTKGRLKKRTFDIRNPAEQIYLQRIEAPHEHAMRKASIRKKKRKVAQPAVMDEDNDIFDMDF